MKRMLLVVGLLTYTVLCVLLFRGHFATEGGVQSMRAWCDERCKPHFGDVRSSRPFPNRPEMRGNELRTECVCVR
jgi:hypothetical protein